MNKREMLLQILCEECGEVIQAASKINRFGTQSRYDDGTTNEEALEKELNDVITLALMIADETELKLPNFMRDDMLMQKRERVLKMFEKSRTYDALNDDNDKGWRKEQNALIIGVISFLAVCVVLPVVVAALHPWC